MDTILTVSQLKKVYGGRGSRTTALDGLSFSVSAGEFTGIMGASGSGKTTLLNCISTIDRPTSGVITVEGTEVTALRGKALSRFRRERLGFIFQDCNLLDTLTGFENIALALTILGAPAGEVEQRVRASAALLGLEKVLDKYPYQMSGGEQQRVAAARAIVGRPALVLADEPTGALDSRTGEQVLGLMRQMNAEGTTVILITHDNGIAAQADRTVRVKDGRIVHDSLWDGVLVDWSAPPARVAP